MKIPFTTILTKGAVTLAVLLITLAPVYPPILPPI